jgi:D-sedoheptulose 7-phosphate isomerase
MVLPSYPAFTESLAELQEVLVACGRLAPAISAAGTAIIASIESGGTLFTCGNGGSAADALHLTQELVGRFRLARRPLRSVCLCADGAALTCIGNDYGYQEIFSRQVRALGRRGDILAGFSTSGNSPNILSAFSTAAKLGLTTILLSGADGGAACSLSQHPILVPSRTTARIQEVHTLILHQWLESIDAHPWPDHDRI